MSAGSWGNRIAPDAPQPPSFRVRTGGWAGRGAGPCPHPPEQTFKACVPQGDTSICSCHCCPGQGSAGMTPHVSHPGATAGQSPAGPQAPLGMPGWRPAHGVPVSHQPPSRQHQEDHPEGAVCLFCPSPLSPVPSPVGTVIQAAFSLGPPCCSHWVLKSPCPSTEDSATQGSQGAPAHNRTPKSPSPPCGARKRSSAFTGALHRPAPTHLSPVSQSPEGLEPPTQRPPFLGEGSSSPGPHWPAPVLGAEPARLQAPCSRAAPWAQHHMSQAGSR